MTDAPAGADGGSVPVEVALIAPALLALLMLVTVAARVTQSAADVQSAASAGARAASLRASSAAAVAAADEAVRADLADTGVACAGLDIDTATGDLRPGGSVSVTVTCAADLSDVVLLAVPGRRTFTARATEVVDTYRGGSA